MKLPRPTGNHLGIVCVIGAMTIFTAQDALLKQLSTEYPLHEMILVRASFAAIVTLIVMRFEGGFRLLRTRRVGLVLTRGVLLVGANSAFYVALTEMAFADAAGVFFSAPLLITALSAWVLGERVGPRRWGAVAVGIIGVLLVLRPGSEVFRPIILLPVLAAVFYAVMQIITRRLGVTERASTMAIYVQIVFVGASATMGSVVGDGRFAPDDSPGLEFLLRAWYWPSPEHAAFLVGIGVINGIGAYLSTQAYRVAAAATVAPFEYVGLPLAALWGFLLFREIPAPIAIAGMTLIISSGLYILHRETVLRGVPR